ncbi:hypothetical protein E2562_005566 [Oryza meyeriana var. granulata]|uniref:Uncharacterized protein n=1 Tax=Oryza meyeriana var. granulata TaxID=110450 RepID=A0A6G1F460_9ORYZ|nr:hypothetical protein E2562_005566 [Oryza meyeriana var. granulata]
MYSTSEASSAQTLKSGDRSWWAHGRGIFMVLEIRSSISNMRMKKSGWAVPSPPPSQELFSLSMPFMA